jgi:hypothetical protein
VGFSITLTTGLILLICHILEKKWENNETVHKVFIGFKKAYDSVRREVKGKVVLYLTN